MLNSLSMYILFLNGYNDTSNRSSSSNSNVTMLTRKQATVSKSRASEELRRKTISYKCCTILNLYPEINIKTNVNTHTCFVSSFCLEKTSN